MVSRNGVLPPSLSGLPPTASSFDKFDEDDAYYDNCKDRASLFKLFKINNNCLSNPITSVFVILILISISIFIFIYSLPLLNSPLTKQRGPTGDGFLQIHSPVTSYRIVIDAGSSGSRIHVFGFNKDNVVVPFDSSHFEHFFAMKGGLSRIEYDHVENDVKSDIDKLFNSLPPEVLGKVKKLTTSIQLLATAGLRLIDKKTSDAILSRAKEVLSSESYFPDIPENKIIARIMSGEEEGEFQFKSISYLAKKSPSLKDKTIDLVDLGGGSVQFASEKSAKSWLGFGLNAARHAALTMNKKQDHEKPQSYPCFEKVSNDVIKHEFNKDIISFNLGDQQVDFEGCMNSIDKLLHQEDSFLHKTPGHSLLSFSFIFDIIEYYSPMFKNQLKKINDYTYQLKLSSLLNMATSVCSKGNLDLKENTSDSKNVASTYGDSAKTGLGCFDLAYVYSLLSTAFKVDNDEEIYVLTKIAYRDDEDRIFNVDASWCLGAAIEEAS